MAAGTLRYAEGSSVPIQPKNPGRARDPADVGLPAPAHHQRLEQRLSLGPRIEKAGAGRGAQPLVTVPDIEVGAQVVQSEVDLARRVRPVDRRQDARAAARRQISSTGKTSAVGEVM